MCATRLNPSQRRSTDFTTLFSLIPLFSCVLHMSIFSRNNSHSQDFTQPTRIGLDISGARLWDLSAYPLNKYCLLLLTFGFRYAGIYIILGFSHIYHLDDRWVRRQCCSSPIPRLPLRPAFVIHAHYIPHIHQWAHSLSTYE
jgi:hypothetical protein